MLSADKPKKKKISFSEILIRFLLIMIILLVVFIGVMIFMTMISRSEKNKPDAAEIIRKNLVVCDSAVSAVYDPEQLNSVSNHDVKMNSEWTFADGSSVSNDAYVENPPSNINSVYFDIAAAGTGDIIYKSPVLPAGSHLENIALDKVLSAGEHKCVLTYYILGAEEKSVGQLQMTLIIKVEK